MCFASAIMRLCHRIPYSVHNQRKTYIHFECVWGAGDGDGGANNVCTLNTLRIKFASIFYWCQNGGGLAVGWRSGRGLFALSIQRINAWIELLCVTDFREIDEFRFFFYFILLAWLSLALFGAASVLDKVKSYIQPRTMVIFFASNNYYLLVYSLAHVYWCNSTMYLVVDGNELEFHFHFFLLCRIANVCAGCVCSR